MRRALPPPPRRREWALAGIAAGSLLAAAEGLLAWAEGVVAPARLTLVWATATLACAAAPTALMGLAAAARRSPYSAMVGAAAGGVLAAPALGAGVAILLGPDPLSLALLGPLAGVVLATLAGGVLSGALVRLEQLSALPVPALPVWALLALLVAAAERRLAGGARGVDLAGLLAAAVLLAGLATAGVVAAHAGAARLRVGPLGRAAALGLLANLAVAAGPGVGPWLWNEPARWLAPPAHPSLLGVILPETLGAEAERLPTVAVQAAEGRRWLVWPGLGATLDPAAPAAHALLVGSGGTPVAARLREAGFRPGAVLADPARRGPPGFLDVRARPLAGALLTREGRRRAGGAPVWILLGDRLAGGPADVLAAATAEARAWLLAWRAASRPQPFALVVDYGGAATAGASPEAVEAALSGLFELADEMGALATAGTWMALPPLGDGRLPVVLRPPAGVRPPPAAAGGGMRPASAVAELLLRWSEAPVEARAAHRGDAAR